MSIKFYFYEYLKFKKSPKKHRMKRAPLLLNHLQPFDKHLYIIFVMWKTTKAWFEL